MGQLMEPVSWRGLAAFVTNAGGQVARPNVGCLVNCARRIGAGVGLPMLGLRAAVQLAHRLLKRLLVACRWAHVAWAAGMDAPGAVCVM